MRAERYLDAWASVVHHRAKAGDMSIPRADDVDGRGTTATRTRGDYIPSVLARYLTVEILLAPQPDSLRALLLHIYPRSGSYYRGKSVWSFRKRIPEQPKASRQDRAAYWRAAAENFRELVEDQLAAEDKHAA